MNDYDILTAIHDEDSFYPNSITDDEPDLDDDDQSLVYDVINETLYDLEKAVDSKKDKVMMSRPTLMKALQLLKAFNCLYSLTYEDYCYNYD